MCASDAVKPGPNIVFYVFESRRVSFKSGTGDFPRRLLAYYRRVRYSIPWEAKEVQTLRRGSLGAETALLQKGLDRAGFGPLAADGVFGGATERALKAFQRSAGLTPDGAAGPRTEAALAPWYRGFALYTIRPGDTLWRVAERFGTDLLALETANPALDPFDLRLGQSLTVPYPFPVTPADVPWCSTLAEYVMQGLTGRYPSLVRREVIGRSVRGTPLWALSVGEGPRELLLTAAHHANEWITAPLLLRYLEELLRALSAGEAVGGGSAEAVFDRCRLVFVPLVDPDGVDLVTGALPEPWYSRAENIARRWPEIPFPSGWKANAEGIDLNLQYPALWETARENKFALGFTSPAPRDYVGAAPLSAPESRALAALTRREDPDLILAFHTQGETIYWRFLDREVPGSRELGERLAQVSGYALEETPYASGFAGYKDWFIERFGRPGYTVEAGLGENPLPLSSFEEIWRACAPLITAAALWPDGT